MFHCFEKTVLSWERIGLISYMTLQTEYDLVLVRLELFLSAFDCIMADECLWTGNFYELLYVCHTAMLQSVWVLQLTDDWKHKNDSLVLLYDWHKLMKFPTIPLRKPNALRWLTVKRGQIEWLKALVTTFSIKTVSLLPG